MIRNTLKALILTVFNLLPSLSKKPVLPAVLMYHSFDDVGWRHGVDPEDLEKQL